MGKFDYPRVGVCLCIVKDNKVLLHKRKSKHANGQYSFPGGHLEKFEDFVDCALRELKEEAGPVKVSKPKFFTILNTKYKKEGKHYIVVVMISKYISGEAKIMEPNKNEGWGWYDWDNMPKPLMMGIAALKKMHPNLNQLVGETK